MLSGLLAFGALVFLGRQLGFTLTLAGIAGFIVSLGVAADSFVIYFERLKDEIRDGRSPRSAVPRVVSPTLQPGTRVPAYCTSNGRVLLAALPQDSIDAWIERQTLHALTPNTIVNKERLRLEIARARSNGYAMVDQELELGLRTIAVPLKNFRGETVAAMNVSVHAARVRMDELVDKCLPALLQAQAQLRTLL